MSIWIMHQFLVHSCGCFNIQRNLSAKFFGRRKLYFVPEAVNEILLQNLQAAFVDARSADRGCYTFRVERI